MLNKYLTLQNTRTRVVNLLPASLADILHDSFLLLSNNALPQDLLEKYMESCISKSDIENGNKW